MLLVAFDVSKGSTALIPMSQEPTRTDAPSPSVTAPPPPSPLGTMEPWNLVATGYAAEALPYFQVFAKAALDCLNPGADARIVDVAAGPGTLSLLAAAAGMRVSAIDFSESMVAAFRERAQRANLMDRIDLRQGDGQQLPFESVAYDAAFSMFGLMFFPDRARQAGPDLKLGAFRWTFWGTPARRPGGHPRLDTRGRRQASDD